MTQTLEVPPSVAGNGNEIAQVKWRGADLIVSHDTSQFANLLDTAKFAHTYRLAEIFAGSRLVPEHFRNNTADCFIALQMSLRLGVDPFMFMQNTYVVHGRPGMEAKLAIALMNSSGLFVDPIDYEIEGRDPFSPDYRVRAVAKRKSTGKIVEGPWIDWKTVKAERWDAKEGTKWKTIPGLMFQYRAATWFGRLHCPERLMGMRTVDELQDIAASGSTSIIDIDGTEIRPKGAAGVLAQIETRQQTKPDDEPTHDTPAETQPEPQTDDSQTAPKDESQATFPECPARDMPQGEFVKLIGDLCGMEAEPTAKALKTSMVKSEWRLLSREGQQAWWVKFAAGEKNGLKPTVVA